jgi:hypothetical protein
MSAIVRSKGVMPSPQCERSAILLCGIVLALASSIYAQGVSREGEEYTLSGRKVGDQSRPHIAVGPAGGYMVWQDNAIDGPGKSYGIAARKLGSQMEPLVPVFRVNQVVDWLQENPRVALMTNGDAAFVWQGGKLGAQNIYFRRYSTMTGALKPQKDVLVNTYTKGQQGSPVITCLSNGNLAVAWCSLHQDKSLQGINAQILTPAGALVGLPFRVNQYTSYNQRSPTITTLSNGHFVVVWVSENQGVSSLDIMRHTNRVHIYGRVFTKGGYPVSNEFRINTRSNICAMPSVAPLKDRGFTVVWAEKVPNRADNWDIYARSFSAFDAPATDAVRVNEETFGDQYSPVIASIGSHQLVTWSSFGHDGSREGVFGRALYDGVINGPELLVNTHTNASQVQPTVAGNGENQFLVAWSSFMGDTSFDVRGQCFVATEPVVPELIASGGSVIGKDAQSFLPLLPATGLSVGTVGSGSQSGSSNGLYVTLANTTKGKRLTWNAEPGGAYQVQYTTNLSRWENVGEPRTATASSESTPVNHADGAGFYRVVRVQ